MALSERLGQPFQRFIAVGRDSDPFEVDTAHHPFGVCEALLGRPTVPITGLLQIHLNSGAVKVGAANIVLRDHVVLLRSLQSPLEGLSMINRESGATEFVHGAQNPLALDAPLLRSLAQPRQPFGDVFGHGVSVRIREPEEDLGTTITILCLLN
jgi:hypothetical protein